MVKPSVGHFHIFGTEGQAKIKSSKPGKFESKTKHVIFVGYEKNSTSLFRCYDPVSGTVDVYDAVVFKDVPTSSNSSFQYVSISDSSSEGESDSNVNSIETVRTRKRKIYRPNKERLESLRSHKTSQIKGIVDNVFWLRTFCYKDD